MFESAMESFNSLQVHPRRTPTETNQPSAPTTTFDSVFMYDMNAPPALYEQDSFTPISDAPATPPSTQELPIDTLNYDSNTVKYEPFWTDLEPELNDAWPSTLITPTLTTDYPLTTVLEKLDAAELKDFVMTSSLSPQPPPQSRSSFTHRRTQSAMTQATQVPQCSPMQPSFNRGSDQTDFQSVAIQEQLDFNAYFHFPAAPTELPLNQLPLPPLQPSQSTQTSPTSSVGPQLSSPTMSSAPRRARGHRRGPSAASQASAASIQHLNIQQSRVDTGVSPVEIEKYIEGPDPLTNKYKCAYEGCNKYFGRKENLKCHIQTHLGDRQYKCPHCPGLFVRQHDLKRHVKIHTPFKPYICDCSQSFTRQDALTRHRQRGMCIGAIDGVIRTPAKRGRPRKQRPNSIS